MIKVLIPSMPSADELLPYLRAMDERKVFVNQGPLVRELEAKIEGWVGNPCRVVANGTVSLELALKAMCLPSGSGVLVPAVTYVASAQAIVNAGLVPVLCDVHPDTWQLDAEDAIRIVSNEHRIRAVMPVATFGAAVPIEPWEKFTYETGLPVLIDAAGAMVEQKTSPIPEIVLSFSLHATKAIGCGEGGAVVTCDRLLLDRVEALATFGPGGTNAKMSEYHAAVGLASFERARATWQDDVANWYASELPDVLSKQVPGRVTTLFPVLLPPNSMKAEKAVSYFKLDGIEIKQWYRPFLDERAEFMACPRQGQLLVTEEIRRRCLGLPWHEFLTVDDVRAVCDALKEILE